MNRQGAFGSDDFSDYFFQLYWDIHIFLKINVFEFALTQNHSYVKKKRKKKTFDSDF